MTVTECRIPQFIRRIDGSRRIQTLRRACGGYFHPPVSRRHLSRLHRWRFMTRRMPRPEEVSRNHIDAAVIGFLKGEKDADWTEVSLVTLHPREEIRLVLKENGDRYRTVNERRFQELVVRLRFQGVSLQVGYR